MNTNEWSDNAESLINAINDFVTSGMAGAAIKMWSILASVWCGAETLV